MAREFDKGTSLDAIVAEGQQNTDLSDYQVAYLIGGKYTEYAG